MPVAAAGRFERAVIAALLIYVAVVFSMQAYVVVGGDYFHEEVRSLFRYHPVSDPALFAGDYLAIFAGAFSQPLLYEGSTRLWLWAGGELLLLHRLLPLFAWLAFIAGIAVLARRLGDRVTVVGAIGLVVAQPVYLHQIASALPHAFAFPLLVWAIVAAQHRSARWLAGLVILAGLLYPVVAPLLGLLLVWRVFLTQSVFSRQPVELAKAVLLVGATGLAALWLLYGVLSGPEHLGTPLEPLQGADVYPENGPEGRHFNGTLRPFIYVMAKVGLQFRTWFGPFWLALLSIFGLIGLCGVFALPRRSDAGRAMIAFIVCGTVLCLVISVLRPFQVYRFLLYPTLTVLPLLFVLGLQQLFRRIKGGTRHANVAVIALVGLFVLACDSLDARKLGYWWRFEPETRQVMVFVAEQPPDTRFAIWPDVESSLELIPYIARRPLLVMQKLHYPGYESHILAMRERLYDLIDAYLAGAEPPLRKLHCRWGVDHLVVNKAHFTEVESRPAYFQPFDARIEEVWRSRDGKDFLLRAPDPRLVALETESYFILDLRRIAPAGCGLAAAADG